MKSLLLKYALQSTCSLCTLLFSLQPYAQEARLRIGGGVNYISNNFDEAYLNDYAAFSLNTSYAVLQQTRFSVIWEQNFSLRNSENERSRKQAFIASFPLTFRFQPGQKTGIYAGMGPAYLSQRYQDYSIRQRVRGLHATAVAGVALRKNYFDALFVEYHIRAGVHRSLGNSGNMAPFLSLLVQMGSARRVGKTEARRPMMNAAE